MQQQISESLGQSSYLCPKCSATVTFGGQCRSCTHEISYSDGICDLRLDPSLDTLLDVEAYGTEHGVGENVTDGFSKLYCSLLEHEGLAPGGDLLEIACGSGLLTASLIRTEQFSSIHCGDISKRFMQILINRTSAISSSTTVKKYLFDANKLPFPDESFDYVFGNSVLHHLENFEQAIADSYRVLKPKGAAIFAEPLLDTHAFVSLTAGLIWRAADKVAGSNLTPRHINALKILAERTAGKVKNLAADRSSLKEIEDKFQFPTKCLLEVGRSVGFSKVVFSKNPDTFRLGDAVKKIIYRVFAQIGLTADPLKEFDFVFDSLTLDYGQPLSNSVLPLFAQILFIK